LLTGLYEPEVTALMRRLLRPGMTLVDVGANVGYYTLVGAGLVEARGRVFAFEPDVEAYKYLVSNIRRNALTNTVAANKALAETPGTMRFRPSALEGGFLVHPNVSNGEPSQDPSSVLVDTDSLDSFISKQGWPAVDVVKLDAEGSESLVLGGMKRVVAKNSNLRLIMEVNFRALQRAGTTPRQLSDQLREMGFRVAYIIEQGMKPIELVTPMPSSGLIYNLLIATV